MSTTERASEVEGGELLERLRASAIGLDTEYTLATGERTRRIYLDSTASTLQLGVVNDTLERFLPYYANTHSVLHFGARVSTKEFDWAHRMVLNFVNADPEVHSAFFVGSGTTGGINRVAATLRERRPERDVVITSIMEHHSNDLPHRRHFPEVVHIPAEMEQTSIGRVSLERLREALEQHGERVNYVAITGVSNVTGIINPVHEVAALAHQYGALIVVDAAAMAAHLPIRMTGNTNDDGQPDPARDLDVVVFSGHKLYAPGSPGVVVTRRELFAGIEPQIVGGGMVDDVWVNRYKIKDEFPDREEAGTPNILGAIGLAASLYALDRVGMDVLAEEECALLSYAVEQLLAIDDVIVYGETDCTSCQRAGALSFNIRGIDHSMTAAVLNDYFNIATRNQCFCAHPYVREMITEVLAEEEDELDDDELERLAELHRGMVRASFGVYSTRADVDLLCSAVRAIVERRVEFEQHYDRQEDGDFAHKTFQFDHTEAFSVRASVDAWLDSNPSPA